MRRTCKTRRVALCRQIGRRAKSCTGNVEKLFERRDWPWNNESKISEERDERSEIPREGVKQEGEEFLSKEWENGENLFHGTRRAGGWLPRINGLISLFRTAKALVARRPAYRWNNDEGRSRGSRDVYRQQPSSKERSKLPPDHPFLLILLVSECNDGLPPRTKRTRANCAPRRPSESPNPFLQIIPSISIFGKSESGSFTVLERERGGIRRWLVETAIEINDGVCD